MTKFVLHGGFAAGNNSEDNTAFYKEILQDVPTGASVLLVPFAKDEDDARIGRALLKVSSEFDNVKLGRDIPIHVANKEYFIDQVKKSDIIYFHGGASARLLDILQQYPEIGLVLVGKIVAGESAGANVWCKYFYSPSADKVYEGLGLVPIQMIPHYKEEYEHKLDGRDTNLEKVLLPEYEFRVFNI